MNSAFNGQILADKLSKLNNSQQSIETLSHWCIFHRKKAKQVVETWDRQFHNSLRDQRVPFLYLANDILQNSRRKGSEFVGEFWKVLPGALKDVYENGDDYGRSVVFRLVEIWEERKVFGSRGRSLREEMLGKDPPPLLENNGKSSHSIKIVRKTPHSMKIKLAVGGTPEKIVSAYQAVHDGHIDEDAVLSKCKAAVRRVEKMDKDVDNACGTGDIQSSTLADELQEQETILRQCIEQLETSEMTRAALVSQLKEALQEQESKLEQVRTQLQVAQAQSEQASSMRRRLFSGTNIGQMVPQQNAADANMFSNATPSLNRENQPASDKDRVVLAVPMQPIAPFVETVAPVDERHKKTAASVAAEVAAKLAASTSSAQMLTSVLSSLAAEEAASINGGLGTISLPVEMSAGYPPEKRARLDKQLPNSEGGLPYMLHPPPAPPPMNSMQSQASLQHQVSPMQHQSVAMQHQPPSTTVQHQPIAMQHQPPSTTVQHQSVAMQHQPASTTVQHQSVAMQHQPASTTVQHQTSPPIQHQVSSPMPHQVSPMPHQPPFPPPQPPPPPPPPPPPTYMPGGTSMMTMPYGYGSSLPPPPPLPGHPMMGLPRPGMPPHSLSPAPYQPLQPPGMGFYSQPPLPTAPPIPRQ